MKGTEWQLAEIEGTHLGFEGHGILTGFLFLKYGRPGEKLGGSGQGFGGWGLGGAYAEAWISGTLKSVGVEDWGDLVGKMVWVDAEHTKVHAIRGLDTGIEFRPATVFDGIRAREEKKTAALSWYEKEATHKEDA